LTVSSYQDIFKCTTILKCIGVRFVDERL